MSQADDRKEFNAEDIRRYIAGEMSRAEMHAMESAALDDPFLSDAIEGYSDALETDGVDSIDQARHELQHDLEKRIKETRRKQAPVVVFRRWQVAAAAAVIITTGIFGYLAYEDKTGNPILSANESVKSTAAGETEPVDPPTQISTADSANRFNMSDPDSVRGLNTPLAPATGQAITKRDESANKAEDSRQKENVDEALTERSKSATIEAEKGNTDSPVKKQAAVSVQRDVLATDNMRDLASTDAGRTKTVVMSQATNTAVIADSVQGTAQPNVVASLEGRAAGVAITRGRGRGTNSRQPNIFRGRLLTPGEQPLSNVVLKNVKTNESFMTDNNGNFNIPAVDSVIQVDVSLIGHQTQRFTLVRNEVMNRLVLPPDVATLSEVVVSGYGTEKKLDNTGAASIRPDNAAPEGGWETFAAYIAANKSASLTNDPPLQVELTFTVSRNGKLSDFNFGKSVSPAQHEEVVRLIKNGPKWKVIKGRKAVVKLTVPL